MTADETARKAKRRVPWKTILGAVAVLAVIGFFLMPRASKGDPYRTQAADSGAIVRAVSATGQLQPVVAVEVGSTVSGPVASVLVDFNDVVKEGQILARIDPESFQQRVRQLDAGLAQATASERQAAAEVARYERLAKEGFASDQLLLQQRTELDRAKASVSLARAQLASAQVDLERTVIRSPVDGVVVERTVDPGQTVAASFSAPKLFVIAQDLSRLEAAILVDEADIGDVLEGMPVRFTVDAYPDETFEGAVSQVRKQGAQTSGVVNYTVIVRAPNPRGRLLPGMTANAEIVLEEKADVTRIPNSALRFSPADPELQALAKGLSGAPETPRATARGAGGGPGGAGGGQLDRLAEQLELTPEQKEAARAAMQNARATAGPFPGPDAPEAERRAFMRKAREGMQKAIEPILTDAQKAKLAALRGGRESVRNGVVWVLRDEKPVPVQVRLGAASDSFTEVIEGVQPGDQIITGGGPRAAQRPGGPGGPGVRVRGV